MLERDADISFSRAAFLIAVAVLGICGNGLGIVLHPGDGEPNLALWTNRPADAVVGRWASNASCVAISANYIITTRHQLGGVGSNVYFDGIQYIVQELWNEPPNGTGADLRVCRIANASGGPANLTDWAPLYTSPNENNKDIVIGGFGKGRGADYGVIGYWWLGSNNQTQRWGQNDINGTGSTLADIGGVIHSSNVIEASFEDLSSPAAKQFEAAVAEWDSGGGWFINDGGVWKVAGLTQGITTDHDPDPWNTSWFDPPDKLAAIRISSYDTWINSKVVEPICQVASVDGDLDDNCMVNVDDLVIFLNWWMSTQCAGLNNFCDGADMELPSGSVDIGDLAMLAANWSVCELDLAWGCE